MAIEIGDADRAWPRPRSDRVSTTDQDTATQQAKLREAGRTLVRIEKVSGRSRDGRSELEAFPAFIRPGDALWWQAG